LFSFNHQLQFLKFIFVFENSFRKSKPQMRFGSWQHTIQEKVSCCRNAVARPTPDFPPSSLLCKARQVVFCIFAKINEATKEVPANWNHLKVVFVIKDVGSSQMMP
jgi:hypothetical protein